MTDQDNELNKNSSELLNDILRNLSEGVIVVKPGGTISFVNPMALQILGMVEKDILMKKFAECFLDQPNNSEFAESFMDAIYQRSAGHESIISYFRNGERIKLRLVTTYLKTEDGKRYGIIGVFSDLSGLSQLENAMHAAERIGQLNRDLNSRNELLSKTFGRYLSDTIVNELLETNDGLSIGGKNRLITILMSDLRGFTALCEQIPPDSLIEMVNHYLSTMIDIIESHNGTIIEIMGDGILAIFGAPGVNENHAADAVAAALQMQSTMPEINKWNSEHDFPFLQMGIGINSGEAIVGNIGSKRRSRFNVIGSEVNLCGRIESYSVDGQVLITSSTKELCKARLSVSGKMTVHPKGIENDLVLYEISKIGEPYNITGRSEKIHLRPLKEPIPICFYRIDEKHESEKPCFGGLTELGANAVILDTPLDLSEYDNISLLIGERVSCKVMEKTDKGYLLRLTAISIHYMKLLEEHNILKGSDTILKGNRYEYF